MIAQALTCAEQTGEGYALAELHRIKGELMLKTSDAAQSGTPFNEAAVSQAGACFAQALTIAKEQGAKSWELRAALSLHRLDLRLGKANRTQLAEIYSSFTEGFETADMREARVLLEAAPIK